MSGRVGGPGRGRGASSRRAAPRAALVLAAVLALSGRTAPAQESSWSLGGELAHASSALAVDADGRGEAAAGAPLGEWLDPAWSYASTTSLSVSLRARGAGGRAEASGLVGVLGGGAAGGGATALPFAELRTLWARLYLGEAQLTLGRQVVNYGRGALWSPVDLFADLDASGLALERRGADALRLALPLGATSGLDLVGAPRAAPAEGRYAARLSGLVAEVDAGLLGAWDGERRRLLLGADLKFDLGASFYAEALLSADPEAGSGDFAPAESLRAAVGADWSLGDLLLAAEYYYNGEGAAADPGYPSAHYGFASAAYALGDFVALSAALTADLEAGPRRLTLALALDLAQNSRLQIFLDAARGSFAGPGGAPLTESLAAVLGARARLLF